MARGRLAISTIFSPERPVTARLRTSHGHRGLERGVWQRRALRYTRAMIENLTFLSGPTKGAAPLTLNTPTVTVFVGPNNSGKSLALTEVRHALQEPRDYIRKIVDFASIRSLDRDAIKTLVDARVQNRDVRRATLRWPYDQSSNYPREYEMADDGHLVLKPHLQSLHFLALMYVIELDGKTRLQLSEQQGYAGYGTARPLFPARWPLLFENANARRRVANAVREAFDKHLVLDVITAFGSIVPRLSDEAPPEDVHQRMDPTVKEFYEQAAGVTAFSDGVKAYIGVLAALHAGDDRIFLIDEPDAFLHPPLARTLGEQMARLAMERDGQVFAATHSAHFMMGAIASGADVAVVRLTYGASGATSRALDASTLGSLMRQPMLRATGVLDALFHSAVILCEGHSDRVFYEEVNALLQSSHRGIRDCLFVNAGGWQNIHKLLAPLRILGIPTAAIVDLDVIGQPKFNALLQAARVPASTIAGVGQQSGNIRKRADDLGIKLKGRVLWHDGELRRGVEDLCRSLSPHGLFVVPDGEVESWLASLAITGEKNDWTSAVLQEFEQKSVPVGDDDVWRFLEKVGGWLRQTASAPD